MIRIHNVSVFDRLVAAAVAATSLQVEILQQSAENDPQQAQR
jgi:hypothetical protein